MASASRSPSAPCRRRGSLANLLKRGRPGHVSARPAGRGSQRLKAGQGVPPLLNRPLTFERPGASGKPKAHHGIGFEVVGQAPGARAPGALLAPGWCWPRGRHAGEAIDEVLGDATAELALTAARPLLVLRATHPFSLLSCSRAGQGMPAFQGCGYHEARRTASCASMARPASTGSSLDLVWPAEPKPARREASVGDRQLAAAIRAVGLEADGLRVALVEVEDLGVAAPGQRSLNRASPPAACA